MDKTDEFIKKAISVHGNKYDYSSVKYIKSCEKVKIICPTHGFFWQTPNNHLSGKGCQKCANELLSNAKRYTTTDFINKATSVHNNKYDYSKAVYKSRTDLITVICPIHGEFQQKALNHLAGCGCQKCSLDSRKKKQANTTEQFVENAKQIHGDKYDYSDTQYVNARTNVAIKCKKHGLFYQVPYVHLRGSGCPFCQRTKLSETISSNTSEFVNKAKRVHGNKYDYSKVDYKSAKENVVISCPIHGDFSITPHAHLSGAGCQKCGKERGIIAKTTPSEVFIKQSSERHNNKYDYSKVKYNTLHDYITVVCPIHGDFIQRASNHMLGVGCPSCNESHLEKHVRAFLDSNHINYEHPKRFDWLNGLSLDFYLPSYYLAIECQGRQHFKPIDYFGGEKTFMKQFDNDKRKQNLCASHGISVFYFTDTKSIKGVTEMIKSNFVLHTDINALSAILKCQVNDDV